MLLSQRVVPPSTLTPIPLPLCLWLLTRITPGTLGLLLSLRLDNRVGFSAGLEVAPVPVAAAKLAPRAASSNFITLHQIKSNKLITNDGMHASSKYRINITDLIPSVLSEKRMNAGAKIKVLCSGSTATIGQIKRSHKVHSSRLKSSNTTNIGLIGMGEE